LREARIQARQPARFPSEETRFASSFALLSLQSRNRARSVVHGLPRLNPSPWQHRMGFGLGAISAAGQDSLENGLQALGQGIPGEFANLPAAGLGQALAQLGVPEQTTDLTA